MRGQRRSYGCTEPYPTFYHQHGRAILADTLGDEDPFGLEPSVIVKRVLVAGYTPVVERPRDTPWPATGSTFETRCPDGRTYLVTIGRDAETIAVREVRADGDGYEAHE